MELQLPIILFVLQLFLIISVGATVTYYVHDYRTNKLYIMKEVQDTRKLIQKENGARIANLKYVVDQINDVHTQMYNDHQKINGQMKATITTLENGIDTISEIEDRSSEVMNQAKVLDEKMEAVDLLQIQNQSLAGNMTVIQKQINDLNDNKTI